MKINLPKIYSQLDTQWANKTFGAGVKIKDYGCLLCCVAMVSCYFGHEETPDSLASKVKWEGNLWIWSELSKLYPDIKYQGLTNTFDLLTKAQMDFIKDRIDEGYPVFLQIDAVPTTSKLDEHWILAVDYNGDDFTIVNPWGGSVHPITNYGEQPQRIIYAYAYYTGKPIQSQSDALTECLNQHTILVDLCNKKDEEIKNLKDELSNLEKINEMLRKDLTNEEKEVEQLEKDKNSLEKKLELLQTEMETKLAKKDLDCQSKCEVLETRMSKDFDLKEQEYKKTIEDLEKKIKETQTVIVKDPQPTDFLDWLSICFRIYPKKKK